ncbi:MAG: alpha/beta fold hydrolase, partial [Desulfomonilaceae bacterium]
MKFKIMICSAVSLFAIFLNIGSGDCREVKKYSIEQFMKTISIGGSSFSFDEKSILFSSNQTGIFNAFVLPVKGGEPSEVTFSKDDSIFALSFLPHDKRILYESDRGGNEIGHIYLRDEKGNARDLTPDEKAKSVFYGISYDESRIYYGSNKRDPKFIDVYEMDIETFSPHMIFKNEGAYTLGSISRDNRYLAFSETITRDNSNMYLFDRKTGEFKQLTPHDGDINYSPETFSIDSKSLYYTTDEGNEFAYLKRYDLESGNSETILKPDWDLEFARFSHSGKYMVVGINNDAKTEIRIYDTSTNQLVHLPEPPQGKISSVKISKSEKLMSFYVNGARSPNNLYVYDFDTQRYSRLTNTLNPEIDPEDLVEAQRVHYKSFDGLDIPAILYKPHQVDPSNKASAMVWVHGGPGGQSTIHYDPLFQYLVNHGYVLIAVNNRGSSGYGKTFYRSDNHKHGQDDLADCVDAKKFLKSTGYVNENRIGIIGGSYGGYMVLAALTFRPEEFALGVDMFGVSNWLRTMKSFPSWWDPYKESLYKEIGNPDTEEPYLRSISPLFHADKIVRPLMVLQGKNDPRVLKAESDEIVEAARKRNVPVEYIVFEDEGHGFVKKENQIKGYKAILDFLRKY